MGALPTCLCGCGTELPIARYPSLQRRYVHNHHLHSTPEQYEVNEQTGCWEWQRSVNQDGYGRLKRGTNSCPAHKVFWEKRNGPVPDGLQLDHLCRNKCCVNPDHLEPVTTAENRRRSPKNKLSFEKAREIRDRYASGLRRADLARHYEVSERAIEKVVRKEIWDEAVV